MTDPEHSYGYSDGQGVATPTRSSEANTMSSNPKETRHTMNPVIWAGDTIENDDSGIISIVIAVWVEILAMIGGGVLFALPPLIVIGIVELVTR